MMKKLIYFFVFMLCIYNVKAKHILGGNISYKHLQDKKYKFTFEFYTDCKECFNNSKNCPEIKELKILSKDNFIANNSQVPLGIIALKRISVKNITNACTTNITSCNAKNGNIGIEKHTYEGYFDLSSLSMLNCELYFTAKIPARNNSQLFFNYAFLNICNDIANSTPMVKTNLPLLNTLNNKISWNPNLIDPDGDLVTYKLVPALFSPIKRINYQPGTNFNKPLMVSCNTNCSVNPFSYPTSGVYLNLKNGDLVYTPIKIGEGIFVIEATEWRKDLNGKLVKIGITRIDYQVVVLPQVFNSPPEFKGIPKQLTVCMDENGGFDFELIDKVYNGITNNITCKLLTKMQGLTIKSSIKKNKGVVSLGWTNKTFVKEGTYNLLFKLEDDGCPIHLQTYRTIEVIVPRKKNFTLKVTEEKCGHINAVIEGGLKSNALFKIYRNGKYLGNDVSGLVFNKQYRDAGTYRINAFAIDETCVYALSGSIIKTKTELPFLDLPTNKEVCYKQNIDFEPTHLSGKQPFIYKWSTGDNTKRIKLKELTKNTAIGLKITDAMGCSVEDNSQINIKPLPKIIMNKSLKFCGKKLDLPISKIWTRGKDVYAANYSFSSEKGAPIKFINNLVIAKPSKGQLTIVATGINGCINKNVANVELNNYPNISSKLARDFCIDENGVSLNNEYQIQPRNGEWKLNKKIVKNPNNINVSSLGVGIHNFTYKVIENGCKSEARLRFLVIKSPEIKFTNVPKAKLCPEALPIKITTNMPGGKWSGSISKNGIIEPSKLEAGDVYKVKYTYNNSNSNSCNAISTFVYEILPKPWLIANAKKNYWCKADDTINFDFTTHQGTSFFYNVDGKGNFKNPKYLITDLNKKAKFINFHFESGFKGCKPTKFDYKLWKFEPAKLYSSANKKNFCEGEKLILAFNNNGKQVKKIQWLVNSKVDIKLGTGYNLIMKDLKPGLKVIQTKYMNNGCYGITPPLKIDVKKNPIAKIETTPNYRTSVLNPVFTLKDRTIFAEKYTRQWLIDRKILDDNTEEVLYSFKEDTGFHTIKLNVKSYGNCKSSAEKLVYLSDGIVFYAPTAFVPFGEGPKVNDKFEVVVKNYKSFKIDIFSPWGQRVFSTSNPKLGWDGKMNGTMLKPGVFAYVVTVVPEGSSKARVFKGTVTMIY